MCSRLLVLGGIHMQQSSMCLFQAYYVPHFPVHSKAIQYFLTLLSSTYVVDPVLRTEQFVCPIYSARFTVRPSTSVSVGVSFTPFYQYEYYWINGIFRSSGTTSYVRYLEFYDGFIYAQRQFRIR